MDILNITDIIGIASFALSGFLIAVRKNLDLLGVILFSFLTALGGGIIRDVIVGKLPLSLIDSMPSVIVIIVIIMASISKIAKKQRIERFKIFILSDAMGLVSFSIAGALVGIDNKLNFFGVIILSLSTAIGGGVLRDILINEVPLVLTSGFYATVSVIVCILIYLINLFGYLNNYLILGVFFFGLSLRLLAYYKNWNLPTIGKNHKIKK